MVWLKGNLDARTSAKRRRLTAIIIGLIAVIGVTGGLAAAAGGAPAATKPTVSKLVDADKDGTFNGSEAVPATATYPRTVTYELTIDAGTYSHLIKAIDDPLGGALVSGTRSPSCSTLVGTTIASGSTTVCYYDVTFQHAAPPAVVNSATIHWDSSGLDTTTASATVTFPQVPPTTTTATTTTATTTTATTRTTTTATTTTTTPATTVTTTTPGATTTTPPPTTTTTPVPPTPAVDLSITKTATPSSVAVGGAVRFDEHVTNAGPSIAHGVTVTDALPAGLTFVSVATTQGTCTGGPVITCLIGTLPVGGGATVTVVTRAAQPGTHVNRAIVTATEPETDLTNNSAQATVTATGAFRPPTTTPPAGKGPGKKTTITTTPPKYTG